MIPGFTGSTQVELPLECTYDLEVVGAKYLHALDDGMVPLQFLFSGTVFCPRYSRLRGQQVPWDREDHFDMPVAVWQQLIG